MQIHTSGVGSNLSFGHHHTGHTGHMGAVHGAHPVQNDLYAHHQQQPTHVTMNINMNMYSNVMNINLQDTNNQQSNPNQISLSSNTKSKPTT